MFCAKKIHLCSRPLRRTLAMACQPLHTPCRTSHCVTRCRQTRFQGTCQSSERHCIQLCKRYCTESDDAKARDLQQVSDSKKTEEGPAFSSSLMESNTESGNTKNEISLGLALYRDQSETLKELKKFKKINFIRIERDPEVAAYLIKANYEKDIQPHLLFFGRLGVPKRKMGLMLSRFPRILMEHIEGLEAKVNYLLSKKFTQLQISKMMFKTPFLFGYSSKEIDIQLGFLQKEFYLNGLYESKRFHSFLFFTFDWPSDNHNIDCIV